MFAIDFSDVTLNDDVFFGSRNRSSIQSRMTCRVITVNASNLLRHDAPVTEDPLK